MRWADVDLEAGTMAIRRALVAVGYDVVTSATKTDRARVVALDTGMFSIAEAAVELGVSKTWARKLLANLRHGGQDPVRLRAHMLERLHSPDGAAAFAKRGVTVEPVFGNLKANLGYRRFSRRGFTAVASDAANSPPQLGASMRQPRR